MLAYAGIGSRETPPEIISKMEEIGRAFAEAGWILRSGAAPGADSAFERGASAADGRMEIFLPWKGFEGHRSTLFQPPEEAHGIASRLHPGWSRLSQGKRKLHARNVQQILGENLDSPSRLVVCWTAGGEPVGGTATGINLASERGIPIFNLGSRDSLAKLREWFARNVEKPVEGSSVPTIASIVEQLRAGDGVEILPFWGHTPRFPGAIDRSCLSNWFPAPFYFEGDRYVTTEHFMMAEKARVFGDLTTRAKILATPNPREAKALGRSVAGFDETRWRNERFKIVIRGNLAKFRSNPDLSRFLLSTAPHILAEASPYDRIWGIGLPVSDQRVRDPVAWKGQNLLGFALMEVRDVLSKENHG
jgi:hypothetical protein